MTRFEYINKNILTPNGIKEHIKLGIVPVSVMRHFEIFSRFDYYQKQEYNWSDSVFYCSEDFRVSEGWVKKIIKSMKEEI